MLITKLAVATAGRVFYLVHVVSTEEEPPRALFCLGERKSRTRMDDTRSAAGDEYTGYQLRKKSIYSLFHSSQVTSPSWRYTLDIHGANWERQKYEDRSFEHVATEAGNIISTFPSVNINLETWVWIFECEFNLLQAYSGYQKYLPGN